MKNKSIKNLKKNSIQKDKVPKLVLELYQYENGLKIVFKSDKGDSLIFNGDEQ